METPVTEERITHTVPDGHFIGFVVASLSYHYSNTVQADIYEASDCDGKVLYMSKSLGGHTHEELNHDCRLLMTITVCWRGTWDERAYPKDEEYWSEEMADLGRITDSILPVLKQKAREAFGITAVDNE